MMRIEIMNKMALLREQANLSHNRLLLEKKGYNPATCTNIELIRGVDQLGEQTYLETMAREIVVNVVLKYQDEIQKGICPLIETINLL